jgi:hypothetical protein
METFAYRQRLTTLHQPLEKLSTRQRDAPMNVSSVLGSSGKGSEMIGIAKSSSARLAGAVILSLTILVWTGCGGGMNVGGSSSSPAPTSNGMTITPTNATLRAGDSTQFSATVKDNANQAVAWWVNGVAGGNATVGTIDATGKYKAPASLPTPSSVTVKATSVADTKLSATSPVNLENPIPAPQSVSPTLLPVGNFSLTVNGANFVNGSTVMFGGAALATTFVSPSQLTATGTSTAAQTGMVKVAVQNPDPGKIMSAASLNVQVGAAGKVTVQIIRRRLRSRPASLFNSGLR